MALDRDQVGLLFKVSADTASAVQAFSLLRGVVEGMAAETSEQLQRMASRFSAVGDQVRQTGQQFRESFGDAARGQLAGYVGQFGLLGDAAAGMIPSLTGSAAAIAGVTGAAVGAGAALVAAANYAMDYTGQIDDLAQVSGLTTETIQSLRLAATLSGQSFEDAGTAAVIFQKQIEAAKGGNEELASTLRQLGVDLNGPVDQAFRTALERLGQVEDGSGKTATALELFGKSGAKLLPVMDQVGGSFDGLVGRARELGLVLDQEAIDKSNKLADSIDILKLRISALTVDIGLAAITTFNNWTAAITGVSTAMRQLFTDASTIIPNLKKILAAGFLSTLPGGSPVDIAALFASGQSAEGFQGPGIDPLTGRPTLTLKPPSGGNKPTTTRAKTMATEILTDNRFYEQYLKNIQTQEQRLRDEQERLRVAAMTDEEARIIDAQRRIQENILRVRLDIAQNTEGTYSDTVLNLKLANLEQEATITNRKLLDLQAQRLAIEESYEMERNANIRASEERNRAEIQKTHEEQRQALLSLRELIEESRRQREQQLAADPSSPFSLMGPEAQAAADRGAGIFGQLGASANAAITEVRKSMGNFGTMMTDVFSGIASGLQNMLAGFIMTGKIGGQAFKAMAAQIISSLTAQAAVKAIFELAEGFAATAQIPLDPTGTAALRAASHFTAAKFYGTVAGVAAAASIGLAAIGGGGGGDNGTMFLGQDRRSGSAVMEQGGRRATEPQVIIIRAETEPGVMVSKFVQDYRANGEARSVLRRDLLGEF